MRTAKFTEDGRIELVVKPDGRDVAFTVRDSGVGMDAGQLARLFQPFAQVHGDRDRYGGTGLGLGLVDRLAHMLGGAVSVDSAPGRGTTFTVTLPRRIGEAALGTPGPPPIRGVL